jgi:hypothetical protein
MSTNQTAGKLLRDFPKNERRELVIGGKTSAGPLAVFMYKNPRIFWSIMGTVATLITMGLIVAMK